MFANMLDPRIKYFGRKYQREPIQQTQIYHDVLQSQQTDLNCQLADSLLICNGGTIRAHGFLLQAASPFIQSCLLSQGENYPFTREILLPDFQVQDIKNLLSLIYKGFVNLNNEHEVGMLQEICKFFQVSGVDFSGDDQDEEISGSLNIQEWNRIPPEIFKEEKLFKYLDEDTTDSDKKGNMSQKRKRGRSGKKKLGSGQLKATESEDNCKVVELSSDNEEDEEMPKKVVKTELEMLMSIKPVVVKLERLKLPPALIKPASGEVSDTETTVVLADSDSNDEKESDSDDDSWQPPDYNDKKWFLDQTRHCQRCKKDFDTHIDAFKCFSSHSKSVRCYFCYQVYSETDSLFRHYVRRHNAKGSNNKEIAVCPFCKITVPFKAVSCHVISKHYSGGNSSSTDNGTDGKKPDSSKSAKRSRSRSLSVVKEGDASSKKNCAKKMDNVKNTNMKTSKKKKRNEKKVNKKGKKDLKKLKLDPNRKLVVEELNVTIEKYSSFLGKTIVFNLKKKKPDNELD